MQNIIITYELSTIPQSFFNVAGEPSDGGENNSRLVHLICDGFFGAWIDSLSPPLKIVFSTLDAMAVLHNTKSSDVNTFGDLFHAFANKVGDLSHTAST